MTSCPSPGQGALAVEARSDRIDLLRLLTAIGDTTTCMAVAAERAFVEAMGGGCRVPIAAHASVEGDAIRMVGVVSSVDGGEMIKTRLEVKGDEPDAAGRALAEELFAMGAADILAAGADGMSADRRGLPGRSRPGRPRPHYGARACPAAQRPRGGVRPTGRPPAAGGGAPPEAEMVDAGKARGSRRMSQDDINRLLGASALEGRRVVRLKGGDPFVFGRGGEEAEALSEAGIPFEVVPGVTSAIAAPAYAGIPVTHRRLASHVTFVSGAEDPTKPESAVDWARLAGLGGTLVVMMGWETLPATVEALRKHGMDAATPVALIEWGTEPYQRTVTGSLADIVALGRAAALGPPVVAVFGEVTSLRERIRWFENKPLFGRRVLVPRTRAQAGALSQLLRERGAEPLEIPTIEIQPLSDHARLDEALNALHTYDWVVFASVNGVREAFGRMEQLGLDARAFHGSRVCAVGSATAAALGERGIVADLQPRESVRSP